MSIPWVCPSQWSYWWYHPLPVWPCPTHTTYLFYYPPHPCIQSRSVHHNHPQIQPFSLKVRWRIDGLRLRLPLIPIIPFFSVVCVSCMAFPVLTVPVNRSIISPHCIIYIHSSRVQQVQLQLRCNNNWAHLFSNFFINLTMITICDCSNSITITTFHCHY